MVGKCKSTGHMLLNKLLVTDTQLTKAASRPMLRAGQRQRYASLSTFVVTQESSMNIKVCFIALFSLVAWALPARALDFIVTEGVVAAPVTTVWTAWTTTTGLKSWLAPNVDIDLRLDGLMRTNYDPKGSLGDPGTIENRVLSFEPEKMLSIRVAKAPDKFPFRTKIGEMWTVLYFEPTSDGKTLLRIVELGFGSDEESQRMKDYFKRGNAFTLSQLQKRFAQ